MSRTLTLLLVGVGCKASWPLEGDAPCEHAGFAIASRVQACTGDGAAANQAFERFRRDTTCLLPAGGKPRAEQFDCAVDLAALDCTTVEAAGLDWTLWLGGTACDALLEWDGGPQDTGGTP